MKRRVLSWMLLVLAPLGSALAQLPGGPAPAPEATPRAMSAAEVDKLRDQILDICKRGPTDYANYQLARAHLLTIGQIELAQRLDQECNQYLKTEASGGPGGRDMGSVADSVAEKLAETNQKLAEIEQRLGGRADSRTVLAPMRDLIRRDKYWGGNSIAGVIALEAGDTWKMVSDLWNFFDCFDLSLKGLCVRCWGFFNSGVDFLRQYRWPVQIAESHQNRADTAYNYNGVVLSIRNLESNAWKVFGTQSDGSLGVRRIAEGNTTHALKSVRSLKRLYGGLIDNLPNPDLPNWGGGKSKAAMDTAEQKYHQFEAIKAGTSVDWQEARWLERNGVAHWRVKRAAADGAVNTVISMIPILGQLWSLAGGSCHTRKWPLGPCGSDLTVAPQYSNCSKLAYDVDFNYTQLRNYWPLANGYPSPMFATEDGDPTLPFRYNERFSGDTPTDYDKEALKRLRVPFELTSPKLPAQPPAGVVTRDLGTGSQEGVWPVTVFNKTGDPRADGQKAMLQGLNAVTLQTTSNPYIRSGFYAYLPEGPANNTEKNDDRFWFLHDKYQREYYDGCQKFDAKLLQYARSYFLGQRDDPMHSEEYDPEEEGNGAWGAGYHFKRFRCCRNRPRGGDNNWCGVSGIYCWRDPCDQIRG